MDIIRINRDLLAQFELIITKEGLDYFVSSPATTFAIGAIEDGMPVGAAVVSVEPPVANLISLYVVEEYRRQGIATMICGAVINEVVANTDMELLTVPFVENPKEDVFKSFFESLHFEVEKVGIDYSIKVGEALTALEEHKVGTAKKGAVSCDRLLSTEKKLLYKLETDLSSYIRSGQFREDLSFVVMDEKHTSITGCIIFTEVNGELVLAWLQSGDSAMEIMGLIGCSAQVLKKGEASDKIIHIPVINDTSDRIVNKLFGTKAKIEKESYVAAF